MAKARTVYVCQNCGRQSPKEMGLCPGCGEYNTMVQEIIQPAGKKRTPRGLTSTSQPRRLTEISSDAEDRMPISIGEFSRVLGGGVVPGSVVLIGGDPGIGKSTLLLQAAMGIARQSTVLYISGEESENQIKMRAKRLLAQDGTPNELPGDLFLVTETNLETMLNHVQNVAAPLLVV
ncbi:MAG: AAA family ATPase, partial [Anaerolineales bacterium]